MSDIIEYAGTRWYRYPESERKHLRNYYSQNGSRPDLESFYHRQLWRDEHGEIPEGHHIHHIDENPLNNDIENLECLSVADHLARHPRDDWDYAAHLESVRHLANEWHRSEEGREWHRKHWPESLGRIFDEYEEKVCEQCGGKYETNASHKKSRFCSNNCKSAWRRESGVDNEARTCQHCGEEFVVNRYRAKRFCNRQCAAQSRVR